MDTVLDRYPEAADDIDRSREFENHLIGWLRHRDIDLVVDIYDDWES